MAPSLLVDRHGSVATLTFNRPEARNAFGFSTSEHPIVRATADLNADDGVKCVLITGQGTAFSAGGDIAEIRAMATDSRLAVQEVRDRYEFGIHQVVNAIWGLRMPVIAAVNGPAIGLGNDLACLADIRIAAESARFGATFLKLGLIPGDGGAWLLSRILGHARAAELLFSGDIVDAVTALEWGLVTHVVPDSELNAYSTAMAERFARQPSAALRATKALLRASATESFASVMSASASYQAIFHKSREHLSIIDNIK